jgi:ribose 5-phosphate isomerase A
MSKAKQQVAYAALEYLIPNLQKDMIIGIGTGSTVKYFIDYIANHKNEFAGCVSSSEASTSQLKSLGVKVYDLNSVNDIPYYIDGADEANNDMQLIKGGGAALTREKIIAAVSKKFICIVDSSKKVDILGNFGIPIEVIPMARSYVARQLLSIGGAPIYREGVITDNGNIIIDLTNIKLVDPIAIETRINNITGVVSNGIFALRKADVLIEEHNNTVKVLTSK